MGKRRANGEGSVSKLKDGRWAAQLLIQRPDGSYTRVRREAKTRAEAMAKLQEARRAVMAGVESTGRLPTVVDHLNSWFDHTFSPAARPSSKRTYRWVINRTIIPQLGAMRLDKLNAPRLRAWIADLVKSGLSPKTINMARSIFQQALDQAVEDRLIASSPLLRSIKAPKLKASAGKTLTPEQARELLNAAKGERLEMAIRLALGLGLRRGEVCGLRWADVDMQTGAIMVKGQIVYTKETGLQWSEPKTPTAIRALQLPAVLLGALRWHQTRQEAEHKAMGWEAAVYIFTAATNGGPLNPGSLYIAFKRIAATVGLEEFRFHDLRHSAASFLLAEGVTLKRVQQILGHARGSTTLNTYAHLLPGEDDDATERIQQRLNGADRSDKTPEDRAANQ